MTDHVHHAIDRAFDDKATVERIENSIRPDVVDDYTSEALRALAALEARQRPYGPHPSIRRSGG